MFFARVWGIVKTKSPFAAVEKAISALKKSESVNIAEGVGLVAPAQLPSA